jgi:uncharacterized damage-inducible protein DinB
MDQEILDWTAGPTESGPAGTLTWTGGLDCATQARPYWLPASHLFNHQAYPRGQLTKLVHRSRQKIHPWLAAHTPPARFQPYQSADRVNLLNASVH